MSEFYARPRRVSAKTAAYQVVPKDFGTFFTTRGNLASITFTLPPTATLETGWWCEFFNVADFEFIITATDDNTVVSFNDATGKTLTFTTATELIGDSVKMTWDGTGWLAQLRNPEAITMTVT